MFLGAYRFHGDPAELLAAYDRLGVDFPVETLDLHICVETGDGIVVLDACPSEAVFRAFSTGPEFRGACQRAGLPEPVVEPIGDVREAWLREALRR
ncbi:MAG: hypothetical protein ACRD0G_03995 [Acidimicrobiales bacterium]